MFVSCEIYLCLINKICLGKQPSVNKAEDPQTINLLKRSEKRITFEVHFINIFKF